MRDFRIINGERHWECNTMFPDGTFCGWHRERDFRERLDPESKCKVAPYCRRCETAQRIARRERSRFRLSQSKRLLVTLDAGGQILNKKLGLGFQSSLKHNALQPVIQLAGNVGIESEHPSRREAVLGLPNSFSHAGKHTKEHKDALDIMI